MYTMTEHDYRIRALSNAHGLRWLWLWWTYDVQYDKSVPPTERTRLWNEQAGDRSW